jgi:hypothetical protein
MTAHIATSPNTIPTALMYESMSRPPGFMGQDRDFWVAAQ